MAEERDSPDVIALPPLIALGALLISAVLEWILPLGILPPSLNPVTTVIGLVIAVGAFAIAFSGMRAFHRAGTNVEPNKPALVLVEDGPYRFTRNPMYIGLITLLPGIGLIGSLDWSIPMMAPLGLLLHHGVVLREEAYLTEKFGDPYREYLTITRRWLW